MSGARGSIEASVCAARTGAAALLALGRQRPWAAGAIALIVALNILVAALWIAAPRVTEPLDPNFFVPEQGHAWTTAEPARRVRFPYRLQWDWMEAPRRSDSVLLEDGRPLGPPHSLQDSIRNAGGGGYSFWSGNLYFSTADNSDPRHNGHRYAIRFNAALNVPLFVATALLDALLLLVLWQRAMVAPETQFAPRLAADADPVPRAAAGDSRRGRHMQFSFFIAIVVAMTAAFAYDHGTGDMSTFLSWAGALSRQGPFAGYKLVEDYPPLGPFLLWCADRLGYQFGLTSLVSVKLMIAVFEAASGLVWMQWQRSPAAAMALYFLIVPFGTMLGYIDAFYAPFLLLMVIFLERERLGAALLAITIAASIKWQAAMLGPFVVLYVIVHSSDLRSFAGRCVPAAIYALLVLWAFGPVSVFTAFANVTGDEVFSGNALNLDWIVTFLIERAHLFGQHLAADGSVHYIGAEPHVIFVISRIVFFPVYGLSLWAFMRTRRTLDDVLLCALVGYLTYFTLNSGVHENHLFPALLIGFACYRRGAIDAFQFGVLALIAIIDPVLFYGINGSGLGFPKNAALQPTVLFSVLELGLFGLLWRELVLRWRVSAVAGPAASTGERAAPFRQRA